MKYLKFLLIVFIMTLAIPVSAQEEEVIDERDLSYEFNNLLEGEDYNYLISVLNSDEELRQYFNNDLSEEELKAFYLLEAKAMFDSYEDEVNLRLLGKGASKPGLLKAAVNYNFNGYNSGALKVGDGVDTNSALRYVYDGYDNLRIKTNHYAKSYTYVEPVGKPGDWRLATDSGKLYEWIPSYGTYKGIPVGREMTITVLQGNKYFNYATIASGYSASIYLEGAKQYLVTIKFYKDVDINNAKPNGNQINLATDADAMLFGGFGLTNTTTLNGTQEYFAPMDDSLPLYTKHPQSEIGIGNEFGKTVYYTTKDGADVQVYADIKNLNEIKCIVGIRGDFDRDPTMHFHLGFDFKTTFASNNIGYLLTVDPDGGNYSGKNVYEGNVGTKIDVPVPTKDKYKFVDWEIIKGKGELNESSFTFVNSDATIKANWVLAEYPITYDLYGNYLEEDNIPINNENNPSIYRIDQEIDILEPSRPHYEFIKWEEGNKIPLGSEGEKHFTAKWEPIKYPITYILDGGTNDPDNPNDYTWFDEIEINEASKEGYSFAGWKEGDYIPLHSEGEQVKTAKWNIMVYDIIYHLKGGVNHIKNPFKYTIEDTIDILEATKEGYDFLGWKEGNKIEKGSTGTKEFTADWKLHEYKIDYILDGGNNNPDNPYKYTMHDEYTIKDPSRVGFRFLGWKEGNRIEKGSKGDKTFTAMWQEITYRVVDTSAI